MQKKLMDISQAFAILGIDPRSSEEEARRAYRRLVKSWHPDRFATRPGERDDAEARLKVINLAYAAVKSHLKSCPARFADGARASQGATEHPRKDSGRRFNHVHPFAWKVSTPPQPAAQSAKASAQSSATDFQDALHAARSGHKTFKRPPTAPSKSARTSRRPRPVANGRSRSMRIEPIEPLSRIRPVAPIGRIGEDE